MISRLSIVPILIGAVAIAAACAVPAAAADPSGLVARISFLSGPVSVRPNEDTDWQQAVLNFPMVAGDGIWTDNSGRAELQLGATVIRLGTYTSLNFLTLDDRTIQLRVTQGTVNVSVRRLDADETIEIDMPNAAATVQAAGFYRFDVGLTGEQSTVTVRQGQADVISGGSAFAVTAKKSAVITGFAPPTPALRAAVASDEWEDWCQWRERRAANPVSSHYVSPYTVGYDDLDEFGVWQVNASYGPVWVPHVATGWTPYGFGHWVWVSPWGWTWVDDAPWGFAPFHYGRWVTVNRAWCWVPGEFIARPVYAPALVEFVGGPVFASFGEPVGWFPLGPREVFLPTYTVSPAYVRAINAPHVHVTNVQINVTNINYVNRSAPNAITVVTRKGFVEGRSVRTVLAQAPEQALRTAAPLTAPVAPRPSRTESRGPAAQRRPPDQVLNRPVVVRNRPAAPVAQGPSPIVRAVAPAPARPPVASKPAPRPTAPSPPRSQPAPQPNPRAADMDVRHAAERTDLESRHAAEQAQIQQRQQQEAQGAANERARQDALRRQQQTEASQAQARQNREHRDLEQRQRVEQKQEQRQEQARPPRGQPQAPPQAQPQQPAQGRGQPQEQGRGQGRGSEPQGNGDADNRGRGRGGQ